MYLVFTCMPGERFGSRLMPLLFVRRLSSADQPTCLLILRWRSDCSWSMSLVRCLVSSPKWCMYAVGVAPWVSPNWEALSRQVWSFGYPCIWASLDSSPVAVERNVPACVAFYRKTCGGRGLGVGKRCDGSSSFAHSEHRFPAPSSLKEGCRKPVLGVWFLRWLWLQVFV